MTERPTPRTDAAAGDFYGVELCAAFESSSRKMEMECADLERELAEARDEAEEQARLLGMSGEREARLLSELAEAKEQRDKLAERIESLRSLCTTDHESKAAFIDRVNAILYPANTPDQPPP